tara:strand:- start:150 stop:440 length:291 start_codon:yes stop_codon:yes gene_type:complete
MERGSIINFYAEYQDIRKDITQQELLDVFGFLNTNLQPENKSHVYYKLTQLEDKYMDTIQTLHKTFKHDTPCIKNFLLVELGYKNNKSESQLQECK